MLKKLFAGLLAATTILAMNVTAFASSSNATVVQNEVFLGTPVNEDGGMYKFDDAIEPNQKIYFYVPEAAEKYLNDSDVAKMSLKKSTNSKLVKSVKIVEKKLFSDAKITSTVLTGYADGKAVYTAVPLNARHTYIEVALNDTTSSEEYKVQFNTTFTSKKQFDPAKNSFFLNGNSFCFDARNKKLQVNFSFYIGNPQIDDTDAQITVGSKGMTIKPVKNDENVITFESDSEEMAKLTFDASSNPDKFYAKLTTKWTSELLAKFKNTDAVIRKFNPAAIDSVGRATLALNNPYDEDDVDSVYIYSVNSSGKLINITSQFSYNSDDETFETKTRTLGTYIISDVKVNTTPKK